MAKSRSDWLVHANCSTHWTCQRTVGTDGYAVVSQTQAPAKAGFVEIVRQSAPPLVEILT